MGSELMDVLQECFLTARKLNELLERDREDMYDCINGDALVACLAGTERAEYKLRAIEEALSEFMRPV